MHNENAMQLRVLHGKAVKQLNCGIVFRYLRLFLQQRLLDPGKIGFDLTQYSISLYKRAAACLYFK